MIVAVLILSITAAVLHAVWNVLLKSSADPLLVSWRAMTSATILLTPVVVSVWLLGGYPGLPRDAWLLAILSGGVELAYFVFLSTAYRRGELSSVYPIARGTAPILAVGVGLVVLQERPGVVQGAGIALLLTGIWLVRRPSGAGAALVPALLTGVTIATYTSIDKVGTGLAPPWLYGWAVWLFTAIFLTGWVVIGRQWGAIPRSTVALEREDSMARAVLIGLFITTTYLLVLFALRLAPLSVIAPLRESAIVLVALWGVWRLGERGGLRLKLGGAAVILIGIVLTVA